MSNYFNKLNLRQKLKNLKKSRFLSEYDFLDSFDFLKNKKIVIIGCGSQGLNQGLNMRDSGLNISYALRNDSIIKKSKSYISAKNNNFLVDTYENLIPYADLVINLTPDKQHSIVVKSIQKLMKKGAVLGYSHGFNIVELGQEIRKDITVIMVAPKCPGTEVRKEYLRNFGVPSLIAVHKENDPNKVGIKFAKSWSCAIGSHKAGVLESSFIAEVKSDLMGEQTILCGLLQSASLVIYDQMISEGLDPSYSGVFLQHGWEKITESLKIGGITLMMDRLNDSNKIEAFYLSEKIKKIMTPLFKKHMDNIISGEFSYKMMQDWNNNDKILIKYRKKTQKSNFENYPKSDLLISEHDIFNKGILLVAMIKAGVELAYDVMLQVGISKESAYYESLHELPLIANTISRKGLYEMNIVISDTAEYGNYLFSSSAIPMLKDFVKNSKHKYFKEHFSDNKISNIKLKEINDKIRNHSIEVVGEKLRDRMKNLKGSI